jgi:hypothetical protein
MVEQSSDPAADLVGSDANAVALRQLVRHILHIYPIEEKIVVLCQGSG